MADQERTEQATPRRREESRKKGQVARSPEVAGAAALLAGLLALRAFGPWMLDCLRQVSVDALGHPFLRETSGNALLARLLPLGLAAAKMMLPVMACCCVGAIAAGLLQSGFVYSGQPLVPDLQRINPLAGARRLFSLRGLGELVKSLLKLGLLMAVAYDYLRDRAGELSGLSALGGMEAAGRVGGMIWELMLRMTLVLALIAAADYLFQRRLFEQSIRMTKQELKEEFRRTEGDPLVKSRLRRRQQQIARGRMMQQVAQATVVVTNPTHVAVALRYEPKETPAPVVLAKGIRLVAERIKEEARRHAVPVVEDPPLARALYKTVEVGEVVPADLYQAVAQIIAFVYRLSGRIPQPSGRGSGR